MFVGSKGCGHQFSGQWSGVNLHKGLQQGRPLTTGQWDEVLETQRTAKGDDLGSVCKGFREGLACSNVTCGPPLASKAGCTSSERQNHLWIH